MNNKWLVAGLAGPLFLVACGGGGEPGDTTSAPATEAPADQTGPEAAVDSASSVASNDTNTPALVPTPEPEPESPPAPAPVTNKPAPDQPAITHGAEIDMTASFSQIIECKVGRKPYYDPAVSGNWLVSFDGDLFKFNRVAGDGPAFGGRFSQLLLPERENYTGSALRRGYVSAAGGALYFVKDLTGRLLAAGDNEGTGALGRKADIECGGSSAREWLPEPVDSPLLTTLTASGLQWQPQTQGWRTDDSIRLSCQSVEDGVYGEAQPATLSLNADGSLAVISAAPAELVSLSVADRAAASTGYYPIPRQAFASWYAKHDTREIRIEFGRFFEGLSSWQDGQLSLLCRPSA